MDLIDRQALKKELGINSDDCDKCAWGHHGLCKRGSDFEDACIAIEDALSVEPEIIYCKDCVKHGKRFDDYPASEACPLTVWRVAEGHECDYQFCVYAERRTNE